MRLRLKQLSCLLFLGSVSRASADSETVTFYGVEPKNTALSAPAFVSFSPIGVGTDGATTYIEEVRESVGVIVNQVGSSSTTVTTTFPVQTYQATAVIDASAVHYTRLPNTALDEPVGIIQDCTFDGKGGGKCVDQIWTGSLTVTQTVSGPTQAFYTLTADVPKTTGTGNNAALGMPSDEVLRMLVGFSLQLALTLLIL